jgi:homocysteine S-methyltransferase
LLERAASVTSLPLVAYANSGQVWNDAECAWEGPVTAADDAATLGRWLAAGARLVGGCCGVGPDGITQLRAIRDGFRPPDLAA